MTGWHRDVILESKMTITLPAEQDSFLGRLVAMGRFPSREAAVVKAVELLETEESMSWLLPQPLSREDAEQIYAADPAWEAVENSVAGLTVPEA
ncbi:type II toxin-antitoxin system ParD family antitoxin [Prosthecobacter sp.]|uniref:ribbon-helix-helix domain-containing protein n=1 Tax=Prosthecobacter sp. TaxID=1965333 RepID=UPI003904DC59